MKSKSLVILGVTIFTFIFLANNTFAQDQSHETAMSMLKDFFADPAARADYASKNPEALQAEQNLSQFPPNIQRRLEKVVLMIMQESGANATRHVDVNKPLGRKPHLILFHRQCKERFKLLPGSLRKIRNL